MKAKELLSLGVPRGCLKPAFEAMAAASKTGTTRVDIEATIRNVIADPEAYVMAPLGVDVFAKALLDTPKPVTFTPRDQPAPWLQWGAGFEDSAIEQMQNACDLPITVMGALMPDAHTGYGLPIGGVIATDGAVVPYAVGMDIACRMKLSVFECGARGVLTERHDDLVNALVRSTSFGVGAGFDKPLYHPVMDEDWSVSPVTEKWKDRAAHQLGSSGSGNHFAEFGEFTILKEGLVEPRRSGHKYLALLTHGGSRGVGGEVAKYYSNLAAELHPELPKELVQLAWLDLDSAEGQEYWAAMELMGRYAAANHALIHQRVWKAIYYDVFLRVENHHNFAWKETHVTPNGEETEVIVHRKGATPAAEGVLGVIPGSMGTPGFLVRGKGNPKSLNSASHGAGRKMSRSQAKATFNWEDSKKFLEERGVELLSAGLDEVPMAYKDINLVMASQEDLVEPMARFDPRMVKMAANQPRRRRRRR